MFIKNPILPCYISNSIIKISNKGHFKMTFNCIGQVISTLK